MSVEHETIDEKRTPFTAGIDWASADHAVAVVDAAGVQRDRFFGPAHQYRTRSAGPASATRRRG